MTCAKKEREKKARKLCDELHYATRFLDLRLSPRTDETRLHDAWDLREKAIAKHFSVSCVESVDDRNNIAVLREACLLLGRYKRPEFVDVDSRAPATVVCEMEMAHTNLTKVTRMVLIEVGTVVVLTTSETATSWMLAVLSYTTVSSRDVPAMLACF